MAARVVADNDDPDHDSIIWTEQGFTRPFPHCFGISTDDGDGEGEYYNYHCHLPGRDYISNMFTSCVVVLEAQSTQEGMLRTLDCQARLCHRAGKLQQRQL